MFLLHDLCFHIVRLLGAGGFGVALLAPGHFQIDGGWVGQDVSCRGVSWLSLAMCGGLRLEAAACSTAALALHAGTFVCVW